MTKMRKKLSEIRDQRSELGAPISEFLQGFGDTGRPVYGVSGISRKFGKEQKNSKKIGIGGLYWVRTSDLIHVKDARYQLRQETL